MPVKLNQMVIDDLAAIDLVVWEAKHPKVPFHNERTGKMSSREDKSWCIVTLAGPGVEEATGSGPTFEQAVRSALVHAGLGDRVPGLPGAIFRLEKACWDLFMVLMEARYKRGDDDDDDIPF